MKSGAFSTICRRLSIGVAHRGRHASGLEHLWTTRPCGFRASPHRLGSWSVAGGTRAVSNTSVLLVRAVSSTSVLLVRAVSGPPALHRLGSWSVAGVTRAVSNKLCTTRPSGFPASRSSPSWVMVSRGRHASGLEHLCTTRSSGFRAFLFVRGQLLASRERFRTPLYDSSERLHRALRATRDRFRPTLDYPSERFRPPRARRVSGPYFLDHAR